MVAERGSLKISRSTEESKIEEFKIQASKQTAQLD